MKTLALFDFDGTLTTKDTFLEVIKFQHGTWRFWWGMALLSPWLVAFKIGLLANWRIKEYVLTHFFRGMDQSAFQSGCRRFAATAVPRLLRPEAMAAFERHRQKGHRIVVVSASCEDWIRPWCEQQGVECLATQLEYVGGKLSGKLASPNCHGPEKVERIRQHLPLTDYPVVYAYGDTRGDREMLAAATHPFYRRFA